jgi:hypothetical protein
VSPSRRLPSFVAAAVFSAVVCAALALPAPARADGTYVKAGGGGVIPLKNDDIALVNETIELAVLRDGPMEPDSTVSVTVTYLFRNTTDRKVRLTMGFPVGWDYREQYQQADEVLDRSRTCPIDDFRATVDGRPVRVRAKPSHVEPYEPVPDAEMEDVPHETGGDDPFGATQYYLWPVTFGPRQERTVVNTYTYDTDATVYVESREFRYVLRSGAAWKGPIERATIRFRLGDRGAVCSQRTDACELFDLDASDFTARPTGAPEGLLGEVSPPGATARTLPDGTLEVGWELTDFEPDADIRFSYRTDRPVREAVREGISRLDLAKAKPARLEAARDTLLALHGLRFDDPARRDAFAALGWYLVDPAMTRERASADPLLQSVEAALSARAAGPGAARSNGHPGAGDR